MTPVEPSLTLVRQINAPVARVYAAWTDPKQICQWWGPDSGPTLEAETDVRPGGKFSVVFRTEDGEEHNSIGEYLEVIPDEKLVFSWHWKSTPERVSRVTVLFEPKNGGTELTLVHERFFDEATRDDHREGWIGALDKLEKLSLKTLVKE